MTGMETVSVGEERETLNVRQEARQALAQAVRLHESGDLKAATPYYIRAVTLSPNDAEILHAAGIALGQAGKAQEARKFLEGALRAGKNTADVWSSLGMAFTELKMFGNAERCFRAAVQRDPNDVASWIAFGHFAYAAGKNDLGAQRYTQAVNIRTMRPTERFSQSMVWLLRGQYRLGWKHYEARRYVSNWLMRNRQQATLKAKPLDKSAIRHGMTVLVEAEQGQGDAVQFARFIAPFQAKYGVTVILQSHNALADALADGLWGVCEVVDRNVIPQCDGWLPMMSLPYYLGLTSPRHVPPPTVPFGVPWTPRVPDGTLRLFVHPRGNAAHSYDFDRTIPDEALLAPFETDPRITVVKAQFRNVAQSDGPALLTEPTWRETVDQLLTCDRVLTVDTGLAHIAASLGIPTDILIPTMPEWRWGLGADRTPWYPSAKLWRRTHTFAWSDLLTEIHTFYQGLTDG